MGARSLTALVELVENNGSFRSIVNTPKKALNGAIIDMNGAATIPDDDDDGSSTPSTHFIGTNVLEHLQIPLVLPELTVKLNQIAELKYVGYTFFGTIAAISIYFAVWTWRRRNNRVVKVAQPEFLILIAFGILIMGAAIIPLSFDDASEDANLVAACMSIPWLISVGFTITFSGLCAKLWRVTAIFNNKNQFQRTAGKTNLQALMPFALLLTANVAVLICWSILDPSTYTRRPHDGLDGWGRIISTYGACQSGNPFYFIAPLGIINVVVLIAANTIAYRTRMIKSEFSESKYIGIAVGSMLQACLVGVPVLLIVQQEPRAYYVVLILLLFIVCLAILLLVFVPKIALYSLYKAETHSQQRLKMSNSIAVSSKRASAFHSKEMNDYSLQKADEQQRSRDRCNNHSRSAAESKEMNGKMDDFSSSGYTHKVLDFSSSAGQGQERHEDANHNSFGSLEASSGDHHKQLQQQIEQAPSSSRRYPMRYDFDEEPVRISARRVSDQSTGHPAKYTDHGLESMETTQNSDA